MGCLYKPVVSSKVTMQDWSPLQRLLGMLLQYV
jgi:hypothetical protein